MLKSDPGRVIRESSSSDNRVEHLGLEINANDEVGTINEIMILIFHASSMTLLFLLVQDLKFSMTGSISESDEVIFLSYFYF